MSILNVLVMGGTRFNGRACVLEVYKYGHNVSVFNRGVSSDDLPRGVERLRGDRHDPAGLAEGLGKREFDCVIDVSAYTLTDDVKPFLDLMSGRIGHYVFVSSTGLYTSPSTLPVREGVRVDRAAQTPYGWNKLDVEEHLFREYQKGGTPATTIAISMVFGPHNNILDREQRMFARFLSGRPVLVPGDGNTLGQIGHVDDQSRAIRMMLCNPVTFGKRYNVTGNDYFTDNLYIDTFAHVIGNSPARIQVPADLMDELWDKNRREAPGRWSNVLAPPTAGTNTWFLQSTRPGVTFAGNRNTRSNLRLPRRLRGFRRRVGASRRRSTGPSKTPCSSDWVRRAVEAAR